MLLIRTGAPNALGLTGSLRCAEVCPVDTCHPSNHPETKEQMLKKWRGLHLGELTYMANRLKSGAQLPGGKKSI